MNDIETAYQQRDQQLQETRSPGKPRPCTHLQQDGKCALSEKKCVGASNCKQYTPLTGPLDSVA